MALSRIVFDVLCTTGVEDRPLLLHNETCVDPLTRKFVLAFIVITLLIYAVILSRGIAEDAILSRLILLPACTVLRTIILVATSFTEMVRFRFASCDTWDAAMQIFGGSFVVSGYFCLVDTLFLGVLTAILVYGQIMKRRKIVG